MSICQSVVGFFMGIGIGCRLDLHRRILHEDQTGSLQPFSQNLLQYFFVVTLFLFFLPPSFICRGKFLVQ